VIVHRGGLPTSESVCLIVSRSDIDVLYHRCFVVRLGIAPGAGHARAGAIIMELRLILMLLANPASVLALSALYQTK
jgi:hypothetical protein